MRTQGHGISCPYHVRVTLGAMDELDLLVQAIGKSPKYRNVCADVVRNVGARELAARRNWKDAVKATKNRLHQVGGAYWDTPISHAQGAWLRQMRSAVETGDPAELRRICAEAMAHHSSTRERLTVLDQFYVQTLAGLPPPRVVLDIACGLNPLALPWMPFAPLRTLPFSPLETGLLSPDVHYYAYDMYTDLAGFLNEFLEIAGVQGQAEACDVIQSPPTRRAGLALLLKAVPCAEQQDRLAGARLLETLQAEHLLVSFPVRSLGGRDKGMLDNYEAHVQELVRDKPWSVQRFEFSTELAFLIHK